jgi:hypothetical protein
MPACTHEALVELIRTQPDVVPTLLSDLLGLDLPAFEEARAEATDLTEWVPTEYRADAVVVLRSTQGPVMAAVVEVQRNRDGDKPWVWPVYAATVRGRLRCPTALLVICPDEAIVDWCKRPIRTGHPGWDLEPLVFAPEVIPVVTDPEQARQQPWLALLSAVVHGDGDDGQQILEALTSSIEGMADTEAGLYTDLALLSLSHDVRRNLEALMGIATYEYKSDFALRCIGRGKVEGKAEDILAVLATRGVPVPDRIHARIRACTDTEQLSTWLRRAVTVSSSDDIFAEPVGAAPVANNSDR